MNRHSKSTLLRSTCLAIAAALAAGAMTTAPASAETALPECPQGVPAPEALPPPEVSAEPPEVMPYTPVHAAASPIFLGVGHLRSRRGPDYRPWDWHQDVRFPLFADPGGQLRGWVAKGWVTESSPAGGEATSLAFSAMTETAYEEASFVVLETRDDGWLRVRVRPPDAGDGEAAWVHRCQLPPRLVFEPWEDLLLRDDISPLFFRTAVSHALRSGPGVENERLTWIPAEDSDYDLEPLERRGDWIRVRLKIPAEYCRGPGEVSPRVWEGWVKWWGPDIGPWLWFYTRGC